MHLITQKYGIAIGNRHEHSLYERLVMHECKGLHSNWTSSVPFFSFVFSSSWKEPVNEHSIQHNRVRGDREKEMKEIGERQGERERERGKSITMMNVTQGWMKELRKGEHKD